MKATKQVYIVDDSVDYLFLVKQVFNRLVPGYPARFFTGGDALYACMQTEAASPALVLMDLNMPPGRSGYDVLKALRAHPSWQQVPVVMMSNTASDQDLKLCIEAGANSFVGKPLGLEAMKQTYSSICQYWFTLNQLPSGA